MKKVIYTTIGCICLALGLIGAALPILPTVPFLLVSSYCFARSNEKLHNWFVGTKVYKDNLEGYVKGEGMQMNVKIRIVSIISVMMLIGFIMMKNVPIGRICLAIVWLAHVVYFFAFVKTNKVQQ